MHVNFVEKAGGPDRMECEAELIFESHDGILAGMKLVGFSIWNSPDGERYVTFPSRAFGAGGDRRFFDYLRGVDGNTAAPARLLKSWIMEAFEMQRGADAQATKR